jgi:hypothetical protein
MMLGAKQGRKMDLYRVREVRLIETGDGGFKLKPLREYEQHAFTQAAIIEEVRRFFEMELSSPNALRTVDFDAIVIVDAAGTEIARFGVSDFWKKEWEDVAFGANGPTALTANGSQTAGR